MRVACLAIPDFSIDVCLRAKPSLAGRPIALAQGASRRTIACASPDARGVLAGMTPKQARAACPGLVVIARDEGAELAATSELLDGLETCGPAVEGAAPGLCYFDAAQLPGGESAALAAAIAIAQALGARRVAAAVADDKFTARCAALIAKHGASIVPAGGSAAFLAPLPVDLLPLAPGDGERFDLLGLRALGQIARLPAGPLAARFGERSREYIRLARGEHDEPLHPRQTRAVHESRFAFEGGIDRLETLLFALRGCTAEIAARLAGSAQACDRVELALERDSSGCSIEVALAEPTASAEPIFQLCRVALESREALGAVDAIVLRAAPCDRPPPQLALFDGARGSKAAALAATLARLHATLSRDAVVRMEPTPEASRLPERMQRATPIATPADLEPTRASLGKCCSVRYRGADNVADRASRGPIDEHESASRWAPALRLVDPPAPIEPPRSSACAGPFRLGESWWARPIERDYYQLSDPAGSLLLVFRDTRDDRWYLQGVFD